MRGPGGFVGRLERARDRDAPARRHLADVRGTSGGRARSASGTRRARAVEPIAGELARRSRARRSRRRPVDGASLVLLQRHVRRVGRLARIGETLPVGALRAASPLECRGTSRRAGRRPRSRGRRSRGASTSRARTPSARAARRRGASTSSGRGHASPSSRRLRVRDIDSRPLNDDMTELEVARQVELAPRVAFDRPRASRDSAEDTRTRMYAPRSTISTSGLSSRIAAITASATGRLFWTHGGRLAIGLARRGLDVDEDSRPARSSTRYAARARAARVHALAGACVVLPSCARARERRGPRALPPLSGTDLMRRSDSGTRRRPSTLTRRRLARRRR